MRFAFHRLMALVIGLMVIAPAAGRADETAEQKEVRTRMVALSKALNAHDAKTVKSFFDPSYTARAKSGETITYQQLMELIDQLLQMLPDLKEVQTIEQITVKGEVVDVTSSSVTTFTGPDKKKQRQESRSIDTWKKIGGKWLLVKGEEL